jgi:hypothetical protein
VYRYTEELGAGNGMFIVEIQWNHFFFYKFPVGLCTLNQVVP